MARKRNTQLAKRATAVFLTMAGGVAARKGIDVASRQSFLQSDGEGLNIKQAALNGGLAVLSGAAAIMVKDESAAAFATGLATGAATHVVDQVESEVVGMAGLGSAAWLDIYDNNGVSGVEDEFQLTGPDDENAPENLQIG
jgi:hypothetical protein